MMTMGGVYQGLGGAKPPHEPTEILKTTEILALYNFYITYYIQIQAEPRSTSMLMELFSSTDNDITFDVIQHELTEDIYPQYYRMVQLALTLPVGSATAERSFSAMRRIRNWLRSTMGQGRFSSLALLNIECDLTAALVPEDIVLKYASSGTRRLQLH